MIDIIRNNDVNLTSLYLSYVHNGLRNNSVNYSQLGALIGDNTNLTQLDIDVDENAWNEDASESDLADSREFFKAIAASTSIEQLRLRAICQSMFAPVCLGNVNLLTLDYKIRCRDCIKESTAKQIIKIARVGYSGGRF